MKPIYIFRHNEYVNAGYFAEKLERKNFAYKLIAIDQGHTLPNDVDSASGLAFLGGTMSVNDSLPWVNDELKLVQKAARDKFPIFGHCFGAQLISKALGGDVIAMPAKEVGWHTIGFIDNHISQRWFSQLPRDMEALLWHEDSMTIPPSAVPLYSTAFSIHQAFTVDNIIATIPHVEVTTSMLLQWLKLYSEDLVPVSESVQSVQMITQNLRQRISRMRLLTDALYDNWISMVIRYNK